MIAICHRAYNCLVPLGHLNLRRIDYGYEESREKEIEECKQEQFCTKPHRRQEEHYREEIYRQKILGKEDVGAEIFTGCR